MLKNQNSVPVLDVDYGIREKMTLAKTQSMPSISEIKNSKLKIRNKKGKLKILNSKHLKTRDKFTLEGFGF